MSWVRSYEWERIVMSYAEIVLANTSSAQLSKSTMSKILIVQMKNHGKYNL